jgi:hypothetical protein
MFVSVSAQSLPLGVPTQTVVSPARPLAGDDENLSFLRACHMSLQCVSQRDSSSSHAEKNCQFYYIFGYIVLISLGFLSLLALMYEK